MTIKGKKALGVALVILGVIIAIVSIVLIYEASTSYEAVNLIKDRYEISQYFGTVASDAIRAGSLLQEAQSYMTGGVIGAIFSIALFIVGGTLISKSKKALQETNT